MKKLRERVGTDLIVSFVVGIVIALVGFFVLRDNSPQDGSKVPVIPFNEDSFVEDGSFVCDGYRFVVPDAWSAWSQQFEETAQCFIGTWGRSTIPEDLDPEYPDNISVVINFTHDVEDELEAHLAAQHTNEGGELEAEIVTFDFEGGSGAIVKIGGDTSYHFKDGSTVVNLFTTRSSNERLQEIALQIIGSLDIDR